MRLLLKNVLFILHLSRPSPSPSNALFVSNALEWTIQWKLIWAAQKWVNPPSVNLLCVRQQYRFWIICNTHFNRWIDGWICILSGFIHLLANIILCMVNAVHALLRVNGNCGNINDSVRVHCTCAPHSILLYRLFTYSYRRCCVKPTFHT